jgi:ferredoxin
MNDQKGENNKITRRDFINVTGTIVLVAGTRWNLSAADEIPPSDGYLLVDIKKCQGCASCMLACSLVHEGVETLSISRIQIMQNPEYDRKNMCAIISPSGILHGERNPSMPDPISEGNGQS